MLDTYSEAKRRLIKFCETSATETEDLLTSVQRVRIPKRKFYSSSEEDSSVINTKRNPNLSHSFKGVLLHIFSLFFWFKLNI